MAGNYTKGKYVPIKEGMSSTICKQKVGGIRQSLQSAPSKGETHRKSGDVLWLHSKTESTHNTPH